ncbi:RNaseH domain-containing protein [Amycolatopsis vastitatis]|uniref:DUF3893 domain-containing protein n=1 Tax=Amycolatopsis vastitatis TaxID=1905142 RepID=A0A229SMB8_9PSEU|nr:RNaseH domain-containing protein [Amycolatopsis vastitatis]OXM60006.1 hypothetical protein CF165_44730 [Amycolatopsis vastitatis]
MPAKPKYEDLKLAAFQLRTDVPWERRLYLLRFPEPWKKPLTTLAKARRNGEEIRSIPITLLNDVIAALVPDVITVATRATIGENAPWIYSDVEVNTESLFAIIATWIRATATDPAKAEAILSRLHQSDLVWTPLDVDFTTLTSDSADEIQSDELYRLLPHVIAAELSAPGLQHVHLMPKNPDADPADAEPADVEQVISQFHRTPAEQGACVMNWPPHRMPHRPLSYMINITAQSRAFNSQPLVHISVGTRRWAHKEAKLSFNQGHSVYMLPSLPWLPGLNQSRSFLVASIESWKKDAPNTEQGFEYSARWSGGKIGKILRELGLSEKLPDPEVLKGEPTAYLGAPNAAALVFRNGMYSFDHPVAPGTSLADKVPLVEWVTNTLADRLVPVENLRKGSQVFLDSKKLKESKFAASEAAQLRKAIADTVGETLGVDIFYDTNHTKNCARATLAKLLGIEVPEDTDRVTGKPETIITDELTILTTVRPVGAWGGGLAGDDTTITNKDRFQAAVNSRIDKIGEELGNAEVPTISLVEIKGKKSYAGKQRTSDPKFAIKVGLSRTGRLSQCVTEAPEPVPAEGNQETTASDSSLEKMRFSWFDLLRQLGVRATDLPVQPEGTTVREAPAYLAFWLVRQNQRSRWEGITRQVPVAVLIDPTGRHVQACAPNVRWTPLHRAQHEISRHHMLTDQKRTPEEITRFFEQVLRSVARQYPSLLLLTSAQNLRWGWPHLNNPDMAIDTIKFGQQPQDITRYPGLRHVRLRATERHEVPDTWAANSKEEGHSAGYWIAEDRIFFSTGEKPRTASNAVKSASKVVPRWRKGELVNPSTKSMVWNARALEFTVAAIQPGDVPEDWAAVAHDLRWATPHYDYSIALPWPLAVAKQLAQYIMPLDLLDDVDEIEADISSPADDGN